MNISPIAAIRPSACFGRYILARGYTTTVADLNALFEVMKEYRERVREGLSSENKSVLSKMETIACYQKNRLNPFTYDIRRIKNGGIL